MGTGVVASTVFVGILFKFLFILFCIILGWKIGKIIGDSIRGKSRIKSAFESGGDDCDSKSIKDMVKLSKKVRVDIVYNDMSGEQTARVIDVEAIKKQGDITYFRGFCHLRGKVCIFRSDRIEKSLDRETGEIIQDLPAFIKKRAKPTQSTKRSMLDI